MNGFFCLGAVVAMKALKDSFRVPERMGWNGDPCAPTNWDAWEGVTCRTSKNSTTLVISQMYAFLSILLVYAIDLLIGYGKENYGYVKSLNN